MSRRAAAPRSPRRAPCALLGIAALLLGIVAASAMASAEARAADPPHTPEELYAARQALLGRLAGSESDKDRVYRIARLALIDRPTGAFGHVVQEFFRSEGLASQSVLVRLFFEGDATARRTILGLYDEHWSQLGQGTDSWRREIVRVGLESEDRELRRTAARLAAGKPIQKIGHIVIDATLRDAELTQAAILTLGANRDARPLRWALGFLASGDPRLRDAARWTVRAIGRPAAERLRERIVADPGIAVPESVDALLLVATPDDSSLLYAWLERHADAHPELADRVTDTLAAIEIGSYRPPAVTRPALEFFRPG